MFPESAAVQFRARLAAAAALLLLSHAAAAGTARARLDAFLHGLDALQAEFRQVLLDDKGEPADESTGTVYLSRPGRFRWDYRAPFPQLIVADGRQVWLYEPDLSQVTVRPQGTALDSTPAALLASDRPVEESFEIAELPGRDDGRDWLALTPRDAGATFEGIRVAFGADGLAAMELTDSFGQVTRLEFSRMMRNPDLDPALFEFAPPDGVDVIRGQ